MPPEPWSDVEQVEAECAPCGGLRTFEKQEVSTADAEQSSDAPSVLHAMGGEQAWACTACGAIRPDPVADEAYPVAFANVGAIRERDSEQGRHYAAATHRLAERLAGAEEAPPDPATEPEALREAPAARETPVDAEDPGLRGRTLREVEAAEGEAPRRGRGDR